jgi:hypothetical protein
MLVSACTQHLLFLAHVRHADVRVRVRVRVRELTGKQCERGAKKNIGQRVSAAPQDVRLSARVQGQ